MNKNKDNLSAAKDILHCLFCPVKKSVCKYHCASLWLDSYLSLHQILNRYLSYSSHTPHLRTIIWEDMRSDIRVLCTKITKNRLDAAIFTSARWQVASDYYFSIGNYTLEIIRDEINAPLPDYCGGCTFKGKKLDGCTICPIRTCRSFFKKDEGFSNDLGFVGQEYLNSFIKDVRREAKVKFNG